jgi:hypothetical protein
VPTYASIDCRLAALIQKVTEADDVGRLEGSLLRLLERAQEHAQRSERLLGQGRARTAQTALKQAIRKLTSFLRRVHSLAGRQTIGPVGPMLADATTAVRTDMQLLLSGAEGAGK